MKVARGSVPSIRGLGPGRRRGRHRSAVAVVVLALSASVGTQPADAGRATVGGNCPGRFENVKTSQAVVLANIPANSCVLGRARAALKRHGRWQYNTVYGNPGVFQNLWHDGATSKSHHAFLMPNGAWGGLWLRY